MNKIRFTFLLTCLIIAASLAAGCGYSLRKTPRVSALRIGAIVNKTHEPKLGDMLYDALSEELIKNGLCITCDSDYTVSGAVEDISLRSVAEKDGVTVLYEVKISGSFHLTGPGEEKKELRGGGVYIVTFPSEGGLNYVIANKEMAIRTAISNMAEEIAASIVYMK